MNVQKGQVITVNETVNKKLKEGTRWVVFMEAGEPSKHQAANALIQRLGKKGKPLSFSSNPNNQAGISAKNMEILSAAGAITIQ